MKNTKLFTLAIGGLIFSLLFAVAAYGGVIKGTVQDSTSQQFMEYANVVLYSESDSTQVTGTITNGQGQFELSGLNTGSYFIRTTFIGYQKKYVQDITLERRGQSLDLGVINLPQSALYSENIVVEGERPPITYEIDRKIIDVASQQTSAAGNAADVLENAPSITVDIEGNVSMRGSGAFTVLIDGRPTVLDAQDALQQIPASTIDNIEIITNPSAKYDPEGTAGIINIITKDNTLRGISGLVNANGGMNDKYGGEMTLSYRTDDYTATIGADHNRRIYSGERIQRSITDFDGTTSFVNSDGTGTRGRLSSGLRAALDYSFNESNLVTVQARVGSWGFESDSRQFYTEWSSANLDRDIYTSVTDRFRNSLYYAMNLDYLRKFNQDGHELEGQIQYRYRTADEETRDELRADVSTISDGRMTTESGPEGEVEFKIDYTLPFSETNKFEAGAESEIEESDEFTDYFVYDAEASDYVRQPRFSNDVLYSENNSAIYSLYAGKLNDFGYQAGIRGEYTYRKIAVPTSNQTFNIDRWDFFPSLHTSYSFTGTRQMMASYSRRIDRPRSWYLEPFETWEDAYNVRTGNPGLVPEYIDSYEVGYQTNIFGHMFTAEAYYRVNRNKIERIETVYSENVTLHVPENVGTDYSLGNEFMLRLGLFEFWDINLMGNLYHYRIDAFYADQDFSRESFNWNARVSNSLKFWENTQFQVDASYRSPTVSAQGEREGFFITDLSVRQDFMDRSLSAILQVRDLFGTANWESISQGADFYRYSYLERESPIIMLTLRLNINNFREQRNGGQGGGGSFDGGDF